MAFTAQDVKTLREMTNVGMMDCKKALTETNGDMDKAVEWLREKGLAKAAKKAGRIAAEGIAYAAVFDGIGPGLHIFLFGFTKGIVIGPQKHCGDPPLDERLLQGFGKGKVQFIFMAAVDADGAHVEPTVAGIDEHALNAEKIGGRYMDRITPQQEHQKPCDQGA